MATISGTSMIMSNVSTTIGSIATFASPTTRTIIYTGTSLFTNLKIATQEVGSSGINLTREIVQYWG